MYAYGEDSMTQQQKQGFVCSWLSVLVVSAALLGMLSVGAGCVFAQDEDGAGVMVSGKATAKDVGLPAYPGSRPYNAAGEDSGSARVGLWGGGAGFKLSALKLASDDAPAKVAGFYQKALKKYGKVLNCGNGDTGDTSDKGKSDSSGLLQCGDDKPENGGILLKAGTEEKQHIVSVEPDGKGTKLTLLYIWHKSN
jgi:hypothetical protein